MKNVVIIKLYRNEIFCADYHDLSLNTFEKAVNKIRSFGEKIGKTIYFFICQALNVADFDCFAEITYSGDLSKEEKDFYEKSIKIFSKDGDVYDDGMEVRDLPVKIFYLKREIEEA